MKLFLLFSAPCFLYEYDYDDSSTCAIADCKPIPGITSDVACQAICALIPTCNYFVYGTSNKQCWPKTSNSGGKANAGWTSGPKTCPSNTYT